MISSIPFTIPAEYEAALKSGAVERFGAILKDSATGQIVAHLQESGRYADLCGSLVGKVVGATSPLSTLSSLAANQQLAQLKQMVESLEMLGFTNLVVSVVGIGINVAGFALMNKRLDQLSRQIADLDKAIRRKFETLQWQLYREHFSKLQGILDHGRQLDYMNAPKREWATLAGELAIESAFSGARSNICWNRNSSNPSCSPISPSPTATPTPPASKA